MTDPRDFAPGAPGKPPYRVKTVLSGLGTSLSPSSRVTFSLAGGIVSEIGYPDAGSICAHNLEWIVTDGADFFSEEKRHTLQEIGSPEEGIPAYRLVNTCLEGKYRITKEVVTDPLRDTLLQKTGFTPLVPTTSGEPYRLFLMLTPHIGMDSHFHNAQVSRYRDQPLLIAQKGGVTLALLCSHPWKHASVGFSGISDGWLDLAAHRTMTREYRRAEGGHVTLTCEIDLGDGMPDAGIVVALGLGQNEREAAAKAWASLLEGFEPARERYMASWKNWQHGLSPIASSATIGKYVKTSAMALRTLESKVFPGALVTQAGVQPRDLGAAFGAYQALDAREDAQRLLAYLMAAQEPGGFWAALLHPDGTSVPGPVARDQVAQVILMVDACRRSFQLSPSKMQRYWPLVWAAATYLVGGGPQTQADRWGAPGELSLYTTAITIAALLAAADMAEERQQPGIATYCRKTADYLQEHIDLWTYVRTPTGLAYYTATGTPGRKASGPASPEALALVRFGLRRADDPRILDTIKAIDAQLKQNSPFGPCWPFQAGDDRACLLYTAERGLYEWSAGRKAEAVALLKALEAHAPYGLFPGKVACNEPWEPVGSDLPSISTHAAYIRLSCALKEDKPPEIPRFTTERYVEKNTPAPFDRWRMDAPCPSLPPGKKLRIELPETALIHWTDDGWVTKQHILTRDTHLGVHVVELSPRMTHARQVTFTIFWLSPERWENKNYVVPLT